MTDSVVLDPDWDSITKEDLEFSVGSKVGMWDVKEPFLGPEDDYAQPHGQQGYPPVPTKQQSYGAY